MKTLLRLLTVVVLTGILVYGTLDSSDWQLENGIQPGAVIINGPPDLQVNGGPLSARNLAPGDAYREMGTVCARNQGEQLLKYRGRFKGAQTGGRLLVQFTQMVVEKQARGGWQVVKRLRGYPGVGGSRLFDYFQFPGSGPVGIHHFIVTGTLQPGQEDCYRFSARLAEVTPNTMQDQALNFALFFEAAGAENAGW